jgi:peptidyl-dipeptidase Dcp
VRTFEVRGRDDRLIGIFLSDNFARPTKRGGAWMNDYRAQSRVAGETLPIVVNNNNFAKAPPGEATLLSADDARTLFHEFGHGLHGLLSQVTYERLSVRACSRISSSSRRRYSSIGRSSPRFSSATPSIT